MFWTSLVVPSLTATNPRGDLDTPERALKILDDRIDHCCVCDGAGRKIEKSVGLLRGPHTATVMGIGMAPGKAALSHSKAFAGGSFRNIQKWFAWAGLDCSEEQLRSHLYLTSLSKCAVSPNTEVARRYTWGRCEHFLWEQFDVVKPKLVLMFGEEVLRTLWKRKLGPLQAVVGQSWSTQALFEAELFKPTTLPARWLALPHPSGMSRLANSPQLRAKLVDSLATHLTNIGFTTVSPI